MGLRARKTIKLGPLRVRATPRSTSLQLGGKRARVTASKRGVGVGVSLLPGLSWFHRLGRSRPAAPVLRDATAAELFHEPDAVVLALATGELPATHTTRLLAQEEIATRRRARR